MTGMQMSATVESGAERSHHTAGIMQANVAAMNARLAKPMDDAIEDHEADHEAADQQDQVSQAAWIKDAFAHKSHVGANAGGRNAK